MRISLFVLAVATTGCLFSNHLAVGPASPRPNIAVAPDKAPSALVLAPEIATDFEIKATGSVNAVPVRDWRHTLEAGYKNAFTTPSTGRTLELVSAELAFSPAAVSSHGATMGVVATIRFKARLVDASGKMLGELAGTAAAPEADVSPNEEGMTDNASKAVESLFEMITRDLLAKT
jgi:hypothetical protein